MGYEVSVIDGILMNNFGEYVQIVLFFLWVVGKFSEDFQVFGLYGWIVFVVMMEDFDMMRVIVFCEWVEFLFGEGGEFQEEMKFLVEIGVIIEYVWYCSGKVWFQMEVYLFEVKEELDVYWCLNGKFVVVFF